MVYQAPWAGAPLLVIADRTVADNSGKVSPCASGGFIRLDFQEHVEPWGIPELWFVDLLDATPLCPGTEPEAAAAAEEEETDPALQSLVPEEAAFGASANPPSPVPDEPRFDALSLIGPVKVEDEVQGGAPKLT
eukprot:s4363_g6.t1